jgi:hypothetical protein
MLGRAVSLGTAGLTSCCSSGSVDPPPPPPRCENLNALRDLHPSVSTGEAGALLVRVEYVGQEASSIADPRVSVVEGASVRGIRLEAGSRRVSIELLPATPAPSRVFFVLDGAFAGFPGCAFQRGFTITFDGGPSIAESRTALPFAQQPRAAIAVAGRDGRRVTLRAVASPPGRHLAWSVSGGTFEPGRGERIVWLLPDEPGLYQAELFVDHGDDGFALDTLVLEVHAALRPDGAA